MLVAEREVRVQPLHVLDRVNRDAAFADLAERALGVAVHPVKRRPVERGAEADRALVLGEIVKSRVRVVGQAQPCK